MVGTDAGAEDQLKWPFNSEMLDKCFFLFPFLCFFNQDSNLTTREVGFGHSVKPLSSIQVFNASLGFFCCSDFLPLSSSIEILFPSSYRNHTHSAHLFMSCACFISSLSRSLLMPTSGFWVEIFFKLRHL